MRATLKRIREELVKDRETLWTEQKAEYMKNGKSTVYKGIVNDLADLKFFEFMLNRYERKLRMK